MGLSAVSEPSKLDFRCPTPIASQWTAAVRDAAFGQRSAIPGGEATNVSFARLKATYAHDNLLNELGKQGSQDPHKQSKLAFANLKENRAARRNLAALNQARAYLYGPRAFGPKAWYSDQPALARRLKNQDQRRQFRMGLKGSLEFLNQLRLIDLRTALTSGDPAILEGIHRNTSTTVEHFRELLSLASPVDVLRLFAPDKVDAIMNIINGVDALADFNQRLGKHLASHPALEPIHDVVCDILRSGQDFASVSKNSPLNIATEALRHRCTTSDADATIFANTGPRPTAARTRTPTRTGPRRANANAFNSQNTPRNTQSTARRGTAARSARYIRHCFNFQHGTCVLADCRYAHQCNICAATNHGADVCPQNNY